MHTYKHTLTIKPMRSIDVNARIKERCSSQRHQHSKLWFQCSFHLQSHTHAHINSEKEDDRLCRVWCVEWRKSHFTIVAHFINMSKLIECTSASNCLNAFVCSTVICAYVYIYASACVKHDSGYTIPNLGTASSIFDWLGILRSHIFIYELVYFCRYTTWIRHMKYT